MKSTLAFVTTQASFEDRLARLLDASKIEVARISPGDIAAYEGVSGVLLDAYSFGDEDLLFREAAFLRAQEIPFAIDLSRAANVDPLLIELAHGFTARAPSELDALTVRLAFIAVQRRDPRIEFATTMAPHHDALLLVMSDGSARLEPRPLHAEDDREQLASITILDDGRGVEIGTTGGARFTFTMAKSEPLDGRSLGARIRELRHYAGITQAELARRTGIHRPNIARVEAGRHTPSLETISRLAEALGVNPSQILR